jgi:acyl-CoA synthetase (AMP-forming)/AMP-acid ligase II
MFSLRLPNPTVIYELLQKARARALVFEPSLDVDLSGCPVLTYPTIQVREQDAADVALPPLRADCSASDLAFVFHTSGSTSGSPKLVPCNRRWLDNIVTKSKQMGQVRSTHGQDVTVAMYGNFRRYFTLIFDLTFDSQRKHVPHWTDEQ